MISALSGLLLWKARGDIQYQSHEQLKTVENIQYCDNCMEGSLGMATAGLHYNIHAGYIGVLSRMYIA
jgi:hypothetical protein